MTLHKFTLTAEVEGFFFFDDITALLVEKNKVVADMAKKVMKKLREEVERIERNERARRSCRVVSLRTSCVDAARKKE